MKALAQVDLLARDLTIIEQCLPAHMLFLMMEECKKAGFELRADVMHHLNLAAVAPLSQIDMLSIARLSKRVDEAATALLRDLSPDDPRHGLYCCAQFILTLVDEGRWLDARNQAVLVALLLMDDVKDDRKDVKGEGAVWRLEERKWQKAARKILRRAMTLGFYTSSMRN
ncbi:MAG: hypothetical protein KJZ83_00445 [Burkholderiaceae bacterium]|nr:hypothetical protein [Burkholderiaceae bacterium]